MVDTPVRICSTPTVPASTAARSSGSTGGVSPPVGWSRGRTARAARTRAAASPGEMYSLCRSNPAVEAAACRSQTRRVSSSPVRWICAAYTNRPTRSRVPARVSRPSSSIFQNALPRNASNPADTDPATAVACSTSLIGSMNRTLDHSTDSPRKPTIRVLRAAVRRLFKPPARAGVW